MNDKEAIIEAMAKASYEHWYAPDQWGARSPGRYMQDAWRKGMRAAYDASPIERYRKALEEIKGEMAGADSEDGRDAHFIANRALLESSVE